MGIFSRFEDKMEDTVEGAASRISKAPISPVQIAKRAERQMRRETMVGAGKEYAPTLYTILVNPDDDARLFGYYPTLAGETETYLKAQAEQAGLVMDGNPLVRFIVDDNLRHGKFDVIAETVSAPIIAQLRDEEMAHYGIAPAPMRGGAPAGRRVAAPAAASAAAAAAAPRRRSRPIPAHSGGFDRNSGAFGEGGDAYGAYPEDGYDNYGYDEPPARQRAARTVAYAGGAAGGAADARNVRARLIELDSNRPYDLAGNTLVMGRDTGCDITVNDISASRNHAELSLTPQGQWVIADLQSTNGTLVNGTAVASQPLYVGDIITIGETDFEFALA